MSKEPYTPTRTCPHPWCKPLHLLPAPFGIAIIGFDLWHNWRFLGMVAFVVLLILVMPKIIHYTPRPRSRPVTAREVVQDLKDSPTAIDLEMQDAKYAGTGWRMLEVRKGWARVAVACDLFFATMTGVVVTAIFSDPVRAGQERAAVRIDASMVFGGLIAAVIFGFAVYAHKKATQPRKPKRAWLPAALRMGGAR